MGHLYHGELLVITRGYIPFVVTQNRPIHSSNPGRPGVPQFLRSPRYPIDAGEEHLVPRLHADHAGQLRQGLDWGMLQKVLRNDIHTLR